MTTGFYFCLMDLSVYPNPARDIINIALENLEESAIVSLYDHTGRVIWYQDVLAGTSTISLNRGDIQLNQGIYFVRLQVSNDLKTKRLVVLN